MYHNLEAPVNYRVNENESSRASVVSLKHLCELVLNYHYSLQAPVNYRVNENEASVAVIWRNCKTTQQVLWGEPGEC